MADNERKIRECAEEQIKDALKYVFVLLGLNSTDIPDDVEKIVLIDFIYEFYGNQFSTADLKNAFKLVVAKEIDLDLNLYGKRFSAAYMAKIMDAYRDYKQKTLRAFNQKEKRIQELETVSYNFSVESLYDTCMKYIRDYQEIPIGWPADRIYEHLITLGKLNVTEEEWKNYEAKAEQQILASLRDLRLRGAGMTEVERSKKMLLEPANLKYETQKIIVIEFWQKEIDAIKA